MRLRSVFTTLLCSLLSSSLTEAALFTTFSELPKGVNYDFIIIGGGTCGNTLANRLTENRNTQVLVLEAGPSNEGVLVSEVPFFDVELANPNPYDWNYTTVPLVGLNNRTILYPRGRVLGGSSSTNWLVYSRGSADDWNRYAAVSGDSGWSWNSILPYFKKTELWNGPADNHNTTGQFDPDVHGFNGIIGVTLPGFPTPIDDRVITASQQLGGPFSFNLDMNSGKPLGLGWVQATILAGSRSSSATGYLASRYLNRPNLNVLVGAQVSRLIRTDDFSESTDLSHSANYTFLGVEFQDSTGVLRRLNATKEVILSAGTIGTPHILMNSGIGDAEDLTAVGITPLVNLPDVGKNLTDHPVVPNIRFSNTDTTFETHRRNPKPHLDQWQANKTGPFANTIIGHIVFARVPNAPVPDTASGSLSPHFEVVIANGIAPILPPGGNFIGLAGILVSPASRGSVRLRSNNPFDAPLIDTGFYTDPNGVDFSIMREALRVSETFLDAPVWADYVGGSATGLDSSMSDEELNSYIVVNTETLYHPVGTSSMSPVKASYGVVNPDLTLKNVNGVRVVDVSVLPYIPSAHTVAAAYGVAERASDIIKSAHKLKCHHCHHPIPDAHDQNILSSWLFSFTDTISELASPISATIFSLQPVIYESFDSLSGILAEGWRNVTGLLV